ncbi:MAG: hypothetical protein SNI45_02355 [Rikenellaceae bacterium]
MNNIAVYQFEILTNKAGQRVVIVDDELIAQIHSQINYEDFDAVLYKTTDSRLLRHQFTVVLSVFTHNAFQFKPTFFPIKTTDRDLINCCDGLADSIDSPVLIQETQRIYTRMEVLGFKIFQREPSFWNNDNHFYAFVRHSLTRGDRMPKMEIVKGSPFGYIHPILYVMLQSLNISAREFLAARAKFQGEYSFVDPEELVCITHVCPKCYDKGMIYQETCPKCGSIDIEEHNMIHHFRCANISPEKTYMKDGALICPKCTRELRHIGVDYDRPTTSYHCNKCSINFSEAKMICECETCLAKSPVESLVPVQMYNVIFNNRGRAMLPITDHLEDSDSVARFANMMSFNQFKNILTVRLNILSNLDSDHILRVYRATFLQPEQLNETVALLAMRIYEHVPHANIAIRRNVAYFMTERSNTISDAELQESTKQMFGNIGHLDLNIDYLEYDKASSPEDFLALI